MCSYLRHPHFWPLDCKTSGDVMKKTPTESIQTWGRPLRWFLPLFVMLFLNLSWAQETCESVVRGDKNLSKKATLDEVWQKLESENQVDNGRLIARPEPMRTLYLTYELSQRIKDWLDFKGYQTELVQLEMRTDLKNFVPARWALKIVQSPSST